MQRIKIIFKGRVQGVGFRYTSSRIANKLSLTGSVENLYDGDVLLYIQGPDDLINRFLDEINNQRFIRIDKMDITDVDLVKGEDKFIILN